MVMEYAYQEKKEAMARSQQALFTASSAAPKTARARITGVNASYKDLCAVCGNVRGKDIDEAIEFLGLAAVKKKAILFARHNKSKGHRRELGGRQGGWPVKSIKIVLGVLENALANANKLGLSNAKVAHIIANKQHTLPRMSPKGKRIVHNYETAFVEVVLEEVQERAEGKKETKKTEMAKKETAAGTGKKAVANVNVPKAEAKANVPSEVKKEAPKAVEPKKLDKPVAVSPPAMAKS